MSPDRPSDWLLAWDMPIHVEADVRDVKSLGNVLYRAFNRTDDVSSRPGGYNLRFIPAKSSHRGLGDRVRVASYRKHVAVIRSLHLDKSEFIKDLDKKVEHKGETTTLRQFLRSVTVPGHSAPDGSAVPLFFSVDHAPTGRDCTAGLVYLTSYLDHSEYASRLVSVLPAVVEHLFGKEVVKKWFHPGSLESVGEINFDFDEDGNWTGEFTTAMDEVYETLLGEAVNGVTFEFEWDDLLPGGQGVLLTAEEASVDTFGTVLGRPAVPTEPPDPPNTPDDSSEDQSMDSVILIDPEAAAPQGDGGTTG